MSPIEQSAVTPTAAVPAPRPAPEPLRPAPAVADVPLVPAPPRRMAATALAVLVCGVLGLLVAPVLLGPAAIVGGLAGEHLVRRGTRKTGAAVVLALTVAALVATLVLR